MQPSHPSRRFIGWNFVGCIVLAAAALAAYSDSFRAPLQFDDEFAIGSNASIHAWATAFLPPAGTTVGGRPFLNASFALNYALAGERLGGYHALNLLIHLLAGLTLWGVAARTRQRVGRDEGSSLFLGFGAALLWTVHPLQTESVTYLSQRAESLMGLLYLFTLYAFIRGAASPRPSMRWWLLSCTACLLGMGTKEVMVSAPVLVLIYDRIFLSETFAAAWHRRRVLYLGLAATWIPLAYEVFSLGGSRGGSTGFGSGISWTKYLAIQFAAIFHYVRLVVWPRPLVFEYGPVPLPSPTVLILEAAVVVVALSATIRGIWRRSPWAFSAALFFAVLAPTSLIPGAIQLIAEHRMYLPSAAVICVIVFGVDVWLSRWAPKPRGRSLLAGAALLGAAALAFLTFARNRDYRSALSLWSDTVAKRPTHALARYNLANELAKQPGTAAAAIVQYEAALNLNPRLPLAHYNLGVQLEALPGRQLEAISHYRQAAEMDPHYAAANNNLAAALVRAGRPAEAIPYFEAALKLEPQSGAICGNLGSTLLMCGRYSEAAECYRRALRINPADSSARRNLDWVLQQRGRPAGE